MITVTGTILDSTGSPIVAAKVNFIALSTPTTPGSGQVVVNSNISLVTDSGGEFSTPLEPGNYNVQVVNGGLVTSFSIAVPAGSGTAAIDTLLSSSLNYVYTGAASTVNFRVSATGLQIFNNDTGLWHTLTVSGNPPQIGLDAGSN